MSKRHALMNSIFLAMILFVSLILFSVSISGYGGDYAVAGAIVVYTFSFLAKDAMNIRGDKVTR